MKIFTTAIYFLLFFSLSFAQVQQEWVARYNGPIDSSDAAHAIVVDKFGNVYVTGYSYGNGTGDDYATVKYNSAGVQLWLQRYNGTGNSEDIATAIAVDAMGNTFVTGSSRSGSGYQTTDIVTIKYDSSGVQQWVRSYNGSANIEDEPTAITVDAAGNVYITGYTFSTYSIQDFVTIKYNTNGIQQWTAKYRGAGNSYNYALSIAVDTGGNVCVTGSSVGIGTGFDYATIKYNSNGDSLWVKRYNGPGNGSDGAEELAVDAAGNIYVTGGSMSGLGSGRSDYTTVKYDPSGVEQWVQRYNGPSDSTDYANLIAVDRSGNVYVSGNSKGIGTNEDYATVKYNSEGNLLWVQRYNGSGNSHDIPRSIALDGSDNVYVTGYIYGTSVDYCTIKYDVLGFQQWVQRYSNGMASALSVDSAGNVFVTGGSSNAGTSSDYVTIKYSQPIGIKSVSNEIPKKYQLEQNYPNPFNPSTKIKFAVPKSGDVKLVVYDMLGREVVTLVNEQLKPGTYEADWNASQFSSGVYFYQLITGEFIQTKRMVLVK